MKMVQQRQRNRLFNLNTEQWITSVDVGEEDVFFDELLEELRIGYLAEPVLYIRSAEMMGVKMLNWLNAVSSSKVFEYAAKGKKHEENPLWFSAHSYHYLQNWLVNELEINIVSHYLEKSVPEHTIPELQAHLKSLGRHS